VLQVVQPALVGLIDGTVSTVASIFASAYLSGSHTALFVGLATALGARISMGLSEALSDDGSLTGRGTGNVRGVITGTATFLGGTFHSLPFLISDVDQALVVAYAVVAVELVASALIRKRFLGVSLAQSLGGRSWRAWDSRWVRPRRRVAFTRWTPPAHARPKRSG